MKTEISKIPEYSKLVEVTFSVLKQLGGSGKNNEINDKAAEMLNLPEDVYAIPHLNSSSLTEINYGEYIERNCRRPNSLGDMRNNSELTEESQMEEAGVEIPEEVRPWRKKL